MGLKCRHRAVSMCRFDGPGWDVGGYEAEVGETGMSSVASAWYGALDMVGRRSV